MEMEIIPIIGIKSHNVGDLVSNGYAVHMCVGGAWFHVCACTYTHQVNM